MHILTVNDHTAQNSRKTTVNEKNTHSRSTKTYTEGNGTSPGTSRAAFIGPGYKHSIQALLPYMEPENEVDKIIGL